MFDHCLFVLTSKHKFFSFLFPTVLFLISKHLVITTHLVGFYLLHNDVLILKSITLSEGDSSKAHLNLIPHGSIVLVHFLI